MRVGAAFAEMRVGLHERRSARRFRLSRQQFPA
jgi:hypothetical protein